MKMLQNKTIFLYPLLQGLVTETEHVSKTFEFRNLKQFLKIIVLCFKVGDVNTIFLQPISEKPLHPAQFLPLKRE